MNRSEYLEEIKRLVNAANEELKERDMFILVSNIYSECAGYIKDSQERKAL